MGNGRLGALGHCLLISVNMAASLGTWLADMNRTHLFNRSWPPHAKFHDAMTISLGTMLGVGGLFFLLKRPFRSKADVAFAAALPAGFFAAQLLAFAFPNTGGIEAEFPRLPPRIKGRPINEKAMSLAMLMLAAAGYLAANPLRCQLSRF